MTIQHEIDSVPDKPTVLIVGAGISGLVLAIVLEKADIPYLVIERATTIRPLGAAVALGPNVNALFKQLGIYNDYVELANVCHSIDNYNEDREMTFSMDFRPSHVMGGGDGHVLPRSQLHRLLMQQIPAKNILLSKRVLSMEQGRHSVRITCADKSTYVGDVLVGADGAYSAVRKNLFAQMIRSGKLPASQSEDLTYDCVCLVGQTRPLDPTLYPELKGPIAKFKSVKSKTLPYSWNVITTKDNRFCWSVIQYLDKESYKENDTFRNSDWGSCGVTSAMCREVRDFPIPAMGSSNRQLTLGDLIDKTPTGLISKMMLEEKVFRTWYHGRTVLVGDAAHKVHPASGAGTLNAIMDAVVLGNWIASIADCSIRSTENVFKAFKAERFPVVMAAYKQGHLLSKVNAKATWKSRVIRYMTKNSPDWVWRMVLRRMAEDRPQLWFLPLVSDRGTVPPKYQPSLQKNLHLARSLNQ
ncbi:hypothetical protein EMPS_03810 [Entomortierella parvispora]|uniref:FAD-binding domain-containing protein n=1 Tax=Entomortierella parvispora TaxID=205924 RepID=A0A9P3H7E9_9FUNG|nr:hypothetical protein EMPS_03810 [Entomortierella parvispora]